MQRRSFLSRGFWEDEVGVGEVVDGECDAVDEDEDAGVGDEIVSEGQV